MPPETPKKIFLIAGEPSGDAHGARLVRELKRLNPRTQFYGQGGVQLKEIGTEVKTDLIQISSLGFTDVLANYLSYRKIFHSTLAWVAELKPDLIILVDFPGFNLRFAKEINRKHPVLYYISPQIWAWGKRRIHTIKKFVERLIVFFPFEKELYDKNGVPCNYVGHPLTDEIGAIPEPGKKIDFSRPVIGILPGSRRKEVGRILPPLLEASRRLSSKYPGVKFILSECENIEKTFYEKLLRAFPGKLNLEISRGNSNQVIQSSDILAVASGTATLETALHGKPFILVYKAAWLTYLLGRLLIRIPFLGIANVLAGRRIVPELIQFQLTPQKIFEEWTRLIESESARQDQIESFRDIRKKLTVGNSAELAAWDIIQMMNAQATIACVSKNT